MCPPRIETIAVGLQRVIGAYRVNPMACLIYFGDMEKVIYDSYAIKILPIMWPSTASLRPAFLLVVEINYINDAQQDFSIPTSKLYCQTVL